MKKELTTLALLLTLTLTLAANGQQLQIQEHMEEFMETGEHTGDMDQQRLTIREEISAQLQQKGLTLEETKALETRLRDLNANASPREFKARLQAGEEASLYNGAKVKRINGELELMQNQARARTMMNLSEDAISGLQTRLSNGRNAQIKIMPETASQTALARLKLRNCNESNNCTIELKEIGTGNQTRAAYQVRAEKEFKVLGVFKNRAEIYSEIDAETGEEIQTRRPWWSFLASEEDETESEE
jgi:hypothetical protein